MYYTYCMYIYCDSTRTASRNGRRDVWPRERAIYLYLAIAAARIDLKTVLYTPDYSRASKDRETRFQSPRSIHDEKKKPTGPEKGPPGVFGISRFRRTRSTQ